MKTTKKHFELFKSECQKWIDIFELNKYKVAYEWKDLEVEATINAQEDGVTTTIGLGKDIGYDEFDYNMSLKEYISSIAKHEVIHLLLSRFAWNATGRYISRDEMQEAEEELVRKLENII